MVSGFHGKRIVAGALLATAALLAALPRAASAHPHAYIDTKVTLIFNDKGEVTALREEWLFDPAYTAFALYDFEPGSKADQQAMLNELMEENLHNLADFGYFTELHNGKTQLKLGAPVETSTSLIKDQLQMIFTLPVTTPAAPAAEGMRYLIFDPSYYIQMRHSLDADYIVMQGAPEGCAHELREPTPTTEQIFAAADLDRNATAPQDLGRLFSEVVTVRCSPPEAGE